MDVVTLVIAVVGLVLSVASLCWQVAQHRLSGPRVRAELLWGGIAHDRAVTGPIKGTLEVFRHAGVDTPVIAVKGRNHGRLPIDVTGFTVEMDGGGGYSLPGWRFNPSLPHRLESGSEVTFYLPLEDVERAVTVFGRVYRGRLRGRLDLAAGDPAASAWVAFPPNGKGFIALASRKGLS